MLNHLQAPNDRSPYYRNFLLDLCGSVTCPWAVTCVTYFSGYIWRHLRKLVWTLCFICTFICGDVLAGGINSHEPWPQSLVDWSFKVWQTFRAFSSGQTPGCRALPSSVASLCSTMAQMQWHMETMMTMNQELMTSINELKSQNFESLASQIDILSKQLSDSVHHKPISDTTPAVPNLLIGGSSIRDVACTDPKGLYIVWCQNGWHLKNDEGNEK